MSAWQAGNDDTAGAARRHRAAVSRARAAGVAAAVEEMLARPQPPFYWAPFLLTGA